MSEPQQVSVGFAGPQAQQQSPYYPPAPQQQQQPSPYYPPAAGQQPGQGQWQTQYSSPGVPPPGQPGQPGQPVLVQQPGVAPVPVAAPAGQPQNVQWMPAPQVSIGCPPGLEYLTQIDQLLIHQLVELLEVFTNWETHNKYMIKNSMGQQVYFAAEQNDCCTLQFCGPCRPFEMSICDNMNREVIHLCRPLRCSECCFPCCLQEMEVQSPPGTTIGYVEQQWTFIYPEYNILDVNKTPVLKIKGPLCPCACCADVNFHVRTYPCACSADVNVRITSTDGEQELGKITKQWGGFFKEAYTDADNFGVTFPMDLDVKIKATLLGAVFLIDFMFFEDSNRNNNN